MEGNGPRPTFNPKNTFLVLKSALERAKAIKQERTKESLPANETQIEVEATKESVVSNACTKQSSAASNEPCCSLASNIENPKTNENIGCEPTKLNSSSLFPTMKWYQTKDDVIVSFLLGGVTKYELDLTKNSLTFSAAVSNGSIYELCTNLFDAIVQELSHHEKTQRGIKATLRKQESGKMWNRLISSSLSTSWLTKDFDHTWFDSDDEDAVLIHRTEPWVDPKYAFEYDQSELSPSSSSDEEMEIIDDCKDYGRQPKYW